MGTYVWLLFIATFALTESALSTPADKRCELKLLASVDMIDNNSGSILIPVTVDGRETAMVVDTGAFWSGVGLSYVPDLKPYPSPLGATGAGGGTSHEIVRAPEFRVGQIVMHDQEFIRLTAGFNTDSRVAGNIGADFLQNFDLEIDQAARKVNFMSQDHCKGQVVHWPHSDLIDIPVDVGKDGMLTIPVELDGKDLHAMIDTGASVSELRLDVAKDLFALSPGSPGMERSGSARTIDGVDLPVYEHHFQTLAIEGVTFKNPALMISEDRSEQGERARRIQRAMGNEPHEMLLGMHQLRQLHLYFAYGEERLYATTIAGDAAAAGKTAGASALVLPTDPIDALKAAKINTSALQHLNARDFAAAIADFDSAIALVPNAAWIYANRALAYAQMGNTAQALQDYGKAVQIDPKLAAAYVGRADLYLKGGDTDAAISDISKAININPLGASNLLMARCRLYAGKQEFLAALSDCGQAVAFSPGKAEPLESRGLVNLAAGNTNDAIDDFDAALNLDSRRALSLMGRGIARQRKGDLAGSRADIATAQQIDPSVQTEIAKQIQPVRAARTDKRG